MEAQKGEIPLHSFAPTALGLLAFALMACFPSEPGARVESAAALPKDNLEIHEEMRLAQFDYTIKPGDTLTSIAWSFGTTIERLTKDNQIHDKDRIMAGRGLTVKFPAGLSEYIFTNRYDRQTRDLIRDAAQQRYRDLQAEGVYYNSGELDLNPAKQTGIAHVYGLNSYDEGLLTFKSSGRRFNPHAMTAASWFYPLGTRLSLIVNLDQLGQKNVEVEVTDRGPNRKLLRDKNVIIDVTPAVARALSAPGVDFTKVGGFNVNIERLSIPLPPGLSLPTQRPEIVH